MHDQSFKNLILDYPRQALAFFAREEAGGLDNARIIPIRQEQLMERLGERFRELDVPLLVEWSNGEREAILFILEEETEMSRFSIHRLAHYCLDVAELMGTERVVPVVIFLKSGERAERLRLGSEQHGYLEFRYLACELKGMDAKTYCQSDNIVARLNLPNMRYSRQDRLSVYAAAQLGLTQLESSPEKQRKYVDFIDYYANLSDEEIIQYRKQYLTERGELMGLAQLLRQEGKQEGRQEGRQEGEAAILLRLVEKRFGSVSDDIRARVQTADADMLLRWADRLFSAQTIDAIFE